MSARHTASTEATQVMSREDLARLAALPETNEGEGDSAASPQDETLRDDLRQFSQELLRSGWISAAERGDARALRAEIDALKERRRDLSGEIEEQRARGYNEGFAQGYAKWRDLAREQSVASERWRKEQLNAAVAELRRQALVLLGEAAARDIALWKRRLEATLSALPSPCEIHLFSGMQLPGELLEYLERDGWSVRCSVLQRLEPGDLWVDHARGRLECRLTELLAALDTGEDA